MLVEVSIEPDLEYSNTLTGGVLSLNSSIKVKEKNIKNNYNYSNWLMDTQYEKI